MKPTLFATYKYVNGSLTFSNEMDHFSSAEKLYRPIYKKFKVYGPHYKLR